MNGVLVQTWVTFNTQARNEIQHFFVKNILPTVKNPTGDNRNKVCVWQCSNL